jgi:hypothetical protein
MDRRLAAPTVNDALIAFVEAARTAERAVFGALPPESRDAATGDAWSAKDILAHLAAWRDRQASRLQAATGDVGAWSTTSATSVALNLDAATLEVMNAQSHAERATWTWERVDGEADASTRRLIVALRATDPVRLATSDVAIGSLLGSGPVHDLEHLGTVPGGQLRGPSRDLVQVGRRIAESGALAEQPAGLLLYNLACRDALDGRVASARRLLRSALRKRPDLAAFAATDADLIVLRGEAPLRR